MHIRYVTKRVKHANPRWQVWDTARNAPYAPYQYRSMHKCNKACDRLNGMGIREGQRYRAAQQGEFVDYG